MNVHIFVMPSRPSTKKKRSDQGTYERTSAGEANRRLSSYWVNENVVAYVEEDKQGAGDFVDSNHDVRLEWSVYLSPPSTHG